MNKKQKINNSHYENINEENKENDKFYFESYAHISIHEEMIKDKVRTETYKKAILENKEDFKDKIILDVGCGTGILSFFCIDAGAKKVYSIDASDIVDQAKLLVNHLNLQNKIEVIKGKIEDIELPEKVDVIISEWMGYFLFFESMLPSIIYARNKFLKPEGKLFPSEIKMFIVPFTDDQTFEEHVDFWYNVYGMDFSPIIPFAKKCLFDEPIIDFLPAENEISFPVEFLHLDCYKINKEYLNNIKVKFKHKSIVLANFHGYLAWFDCIFKGTQKTLILTTSPEKEETHWKQTLFYIGDSYIVNQDDEIEGEMIISKNQNNDRLLDIYIKFIIQGSIKIEKRYQLK